MSGKEILSQETVKGAMSFTVIADKLEKPAAPDGKAKKDHFRTLQCTHYGSPVHSMCSTPQWHIENIKLITHHAQVEVEVTQNTPALKTTRNIFLICNSAKKKRPEFD